jgi:hypothetical protein
MIGDTVENIGEPGFGIDIVQLRRLDKGEHIGRPNAAAIRTCKEPRLSAKSNSTQCPFGRIFFSAGVEGGASLLEKLNKVNDRFLLVWRFRNSPEHCGGLRANF